MFEKLLNEHPKNISIDIIDAIMRDLINGRSKSYSDALIVHIVMALCYHVLNKYDDQVIVLVIPQKELAKKAKLKDAIGLTSNNHIYLSYESALKLRRGNIEVINTIMHEVRHVRNHHLVDSPTISYEAYQLIMEEIVTSKMTHRYYEDNYWYLYDEIDARKAAAINTYRYIKRICPKKAVTMVPSLNREIDECEEELKVLKRKVNGKSYSREELCDRIIKRDPNILNNYPLLVFYYDHKGNKKSAGHILQRQVDAHNLDHDQELVEQLLKLDQEILRYRSGTRTNIEKDISSLKGFVTREGVEEPLRASCQKVITNLDKRLIEDDFGDNIIDIFDSAQGCISRLHIRFYKGIRKLKNLSIRLYCNWIMFNQEPKKFILKKK